MFDRGLNQMADIKDFLGPVQYCGSYNTNVNSQNVMELMASGNQSGTEPKLITKILSTNFGKHLWMGYQNW